MKTFAIFFNGYYPVGAVAVVTAKSEKHAKTNFSRKLKRMKLDPKFLEIREVNTTSNSVDILLDGDY